MTHQSAFYEAKVDVGSRSLSLRSFCHGSRYEPLPDIWAIPDILEQGDVHCRTRRRELGKVVGLHLVGRCLRGEASKLAIQAKSSCNDVKTMFELRAARSDALTFAESETRRRSPLMFTISNVHSTSRSPAHRSSASSECHLVNL